MLVLTLGTTRTRKLPIPGSPSDHRAIKNFMRDVKHVVAELKGPNHHAHNPSN